MSRAIPALSALAACLALAGCAAQNPPGRDDRPASAPDVREQGGRAGTATPDAANPWPSATGANGHGSSAPARPDKGGKVKKKEADKHPKKPEPTATDKAKGKAKKEPRKAVRDLVDKLIPGADKKLPRWAIPIVADVEEGALPGAAVQAFMAGDKLVVSATVKAPTGHVHAASLVATPATHTVDMVMIVENPATATKKDPATVTVTAVDTEAPTAEPVTVTAEVTVPATVDTVAVDTVATAVEDVCGIPA
ncbi:hypothetical protein WEB32_29820 [Streptomyces netropsis]|uniref:hypothetical protein n=1 Tax=Streptomyces netropsis TaxID=55404 RepID=UPI0030D123C1